MSRQRLVIDASVAVKWLHPEEDSGQATSLIEADYELFVPDLLISEIGNVLWKRSRRDNLSGATVQRLLTESSSTSACTGSLCKDLHSAEGF